MSGDDARFTPGEIRRALERIEKDIKEIKDDNSKRLAVLEKDSATHCADLDWLKRGLWTVVGIGLSALVTALFALLKFKTNGG